MPYDPTDDIMDYLNGVYTGTYKVGDLVRVNPKRAGRLTACNVSANKVYTVRDKKKSIAEKIFLEGIESEIPYLGKDFLPIKAKDAAYFRKHGTFHVRTQAVRDLVEPTYALDA